ncbi:hypothetical protein SAMN05444162_4970 [Paenibacillaceae bacterium GAS479]|nr:hypothetical protein SAMN05444162_4970 [Paenibacillaceae bacterium GAS479]
MRSTGFGMVLILFILLVIATTFIYIPTRGDNLPTDDLITIQATQGFNIYNRTTDFALVTALLEGEFASPFPPSHTILPFRSYHFEVKVTSPFSSNSAYVTYNVVSGAEIVGNIRINMRARGAAPPKPLTIVDFINGPIEYDNGNTYVTIRDE